LGGIRVVIHSDVNQMIIILVGILVCGSVALSFVGWDTAWATFTAHSGSVCFGHAVVVAGHFHFMALVESHRVHEYHDHGQSPFWVGQTT